MFLKSFGTSQLSHKSVNLSFIIANIRNKLTDLCGKALLQNNFEHSLCEMKRQRGARRPARPSQPSSNAPAKPGVKRRIISKPQIRGEAGAGHSRRQPETDRLSGPAHSRQGTSHEITASINLERDSESERARKKQTERLFFIIIYMFICIYTYYIYIYIYILVWRRVSGSCWSGRARRARAAAPVFRAAGFGFRVSGVKCPCISGCGFRVSCFGFRVQGWGILQGLDSFGISA